MNILHSQSGKGAVFAEDNFMQKLYFTRAATVTRNAARLRWLTDSSPGRKEDQTVSFVLLVLSMARVPFQVIDAFACFFSFPSLTLSTLKADRVSSP